MNEVAPRPRFARARTAAWLVPALLLVARVAAAQSGDPEAPAAEEAPVPSPAAPEAPAAGEAPVPSPAAPEAPPPPTEVTIVGTSVAKTSGSAHVIKSRQLERFRYDDPHAVLASVPGVYTRGEDGAGLRPNIGLRGVNPDRSKKVTLTEDGVLFGPAPYSAPAAYYFPLMSRIASVRVLKGPGAIAEGPQTVAGAIDLVTRAIPATTGGSFDLGVGEHGWARAHGWFGSSDERTGWLVEGAHLRSDGFKELQGGGDTGFYRNEWMLKGSHLLDPAARAQNELRLKLVYSDEVSNETYLGLSDADFRANPNQRYAASRLDRMKNHRTGVAVSHVLTSGRELSLTTTAYRNDYARTWRKVNGFRGASLFDVLRDPTQPRNAVYYAVISGRADGSSSSEAILIGPNEREFVSQGVQSRLRWDGTSGPLAHRFEAGVRLHHDRIERRHSEDAFALIRGRLIPEGTATVVTAFNEAWTHALAVHATDAVTWGRLTVTPGVRVEALRSGFLDRSTGAESTRTAVAVLPGAGAFFSLTRRLGVLAGVHRGFSPPAPGSAQRVEPELSVNYETGARWADGPMRAEVIGYYNDYSNITDVCTLSSGCVDANLDRQFDAGRARIYGVEAYVEHEIPAGPVKLPVHAAYTLTRAEFLTSFASEDPIFGVVRAGDEMPYVPRHQASVSAGVETADGGVAVVGNYVAAMREEAGSEPLSQVLATDDQYWLDASARWRVIGRVSLFANVRNVLGRQFIVSHRPYGARPNAPRWIQVGAKVDF